MKRRLVLLAAALGLLLSFAAAATWMSSATQDAGYHAGAAAAAAAPTEVREAPPAPASTAVEVTPGEQSQEDTAVKTGCGKPTPCPDRDCADCPSNRYLK
jgi:hypothetical protein